MSQAQDGLALMAQAIVEGIPLPNWITSEAGPATWPS